MARLTPLRAAGELCAVAALLAGLAALTPASWRPSAPPAPAVALSPYSVDLATVRGDARFTEVLWLDARREVDFNAGHIPGALPFTEADWDTHLTSLLDHWTPERAIVVYCDSPACGTSERIAERLRRELGTESVFALVGGWTAWSESAPAP